MSERYSHDEAAQVIGDMLKAQGYSDVRPRFKPNGIRLENSYTVRKARHRLSVCEVLERTEGFSHSAGVMSSEWFGHNVAARLFGLKGAKSADLEFDGDHRWFVRFCAKLLDKIGIH